MFRIFMSAIILLFVAACSSVDNDKKEKTSEDMFNEYIGFFLNQKDDEVFDLSSSKNIKETSRFFRELAKVSSEAGFFDSKLFGVNSLKELNSLPDEKLYKNLLKHTLLSASQLNSSGVTFKFIGETNEGASTKYFVYKIVGHEKMDFLESDTIKTIKVDKEDDKWKFSTFDLGDPKFKSLMLAYKNKSLQKNADVLMKEIEKISKEMDKRKLKDMTIEERIQRMKEKTLK